MMETPTRPHVPFHSDSAFASHRRTLTLPTNLPGHTMSGLPGYSKAVKADNEDGTGCNEKGKTAAAQPAAAQPA